MSAQIETGSRLPEESWSRRATQGKGRRSISNGVRPQDVAAARASGEETSPEESFTRQVMEYYPSEDQESWNRWLVLLGSVGVVGAVMGATGFLKK